MTPFIFDLDGTLTRQETLPLIAAQFHVQEDIAALTERTLRGEIPFTASFRRRVELLKGFPVDEIDRLLAQVGLHEQVLRFIREHADCCCIATGNLGAWVHGLVERIGCPCFCSEAEIVDNRVSRLVHILRKETVVRRYQEAGRRVVFIGDGHNDAGAMRQADIAIASALTHPPVPSVLRETDYLASTEAGLCRRLEQLLHEENE